MAPKARTKTGRKRAQRPYETGPDRVPANHQPLTPLTFLERAAHIFPDRTAVIHGAQHFSYAQF